MHLAKALAPLARRFVAGETAEEAVIAARSMNARGIGAILDFLGEDVRTPTDALAAVEEYCLLIARIRSDNVDACISVKASQMGLLISSELCHRNLGQVLTVAAAADVFVWMDMEGSALTQRTIEAFQTLRKVHSRFGLCIQASLIRTAQDLDSLLQPAATLRLCKGAYQEPPDVAYDEKRTVDGNYRLLAQRLLRQTAAGTYPAFATHDPALLEYVCAQAHQGGARPDQFEFQMLYGIQNTRLASLAKAGYRTRVYIPYGTAWLPYFCRRLRERRENIYFLLKNLFRR